MFFQTITIRVSVGIIGVIICSGITFAETLPPLRLCPASPSPHSSKVPVNSNLYGDNFYGNNLYSDSFSGDNFYRETNNVYRKEHWSWRLFPDGFVYPNYLAAIQNRLAGGFNYDSDIKDWHADVTLGGRAPLVRYGTTTGFLPEGWQIDLEGSVQIRLATYEGMDMEANDFRVGLPITYGTKIWQVKTGYYHVSTHIGDERLIRYLPAGETQFDPRDRRYSDEGPHRLNYVREAWLLGYAYRPTPNMRLYAEVDYAFARGEKTKPWHFQFGAEYSPLYPARGGWGTPFAAVNARLMQEHDFDGTFTLQTGWQWRGSHNQLFRLGFQYMTGVSEQYTFLNHPREHKVGFGLWYDF